MLNQGAPCEDVLTQLIAARSALDQIGLLIIDEYIDNCIHSDSQVQVKDNVRRIFSMVLARYSTPASREDLSYSSSQSHQDLKTH